MKTRTIIEMRDGLREDRLIASSVSRKGDVLATKKYMMEDRLHSYVRWFCMTEEQRRDKKNRYRIEKEAYTATRRAIKWVVVIEDELGQEVKPEAGGETL